MADEETQEVTEEKEEEIWNEATEEEPSKEETDDSEGETTEEEKEEEDQGGAEEDKEKSEEESEEVDYKAQAEQLKTEKEKAEKMAKDNKAFADDVLRKQAEEKKKAEEERAKAEETAEPPDDVKALIEEYPAVQKAIDFYGDRRIRKAIEDYEKPLIEAAGGRKPVELIAETYELNKTLTFERTVMFGYYEEGKRIPGHPDVLEITDSPEFEKWANGKAAKDHAFERDANSDDPRVAIKVLNLYKEERLKEEGDKKKAELHKTKEEMEESMTSADRETVRKGRKAEPDKLDEDQAARDAGFTT